MPLDEEGAKWSCEPCIRGHRSSKCQHFDRLMMKVPKAGRPLQKCPHPKGTCSCQKLYAFMVRIPKGSTCLCRPLYKVPVTGEVDQQLQPKPPQSAPPERQDDSKRSPTAAAPAASPSIGAASANRVQKRTKRQNSIQASTDSVARGLGMLPAASTHVKKEASAPAALSSIDSSAVEEDGTATASPTAEEGGCCGSKRSTKGRTPTPVDSKQNAHEIPAYIHQYPSSTQSGLLHKSSSTHSLVSPSAPPPESLVLGPTGGRYGEYPSSSHSLPNTTFPSPTIPQFHQPQLQQPNIYGQTSFSRDFSLGLPAIYNQSLPVVGCKDHNCDCGDGCQCLGCASHPYNDRTRHHIQEMGYIMAFENGYQPLETTTADDIQSTAYNTHIPPNPQYDSHLHNFGQSSSSNYIHNAPFHQHIFPYDNNSPVSTAIPQTPTITTTATAATAAASNGELLMSPTAYYTVEYPVSLLDPCTNLTGTCQCGLNCSCVGCLTHHGHSGISAEPSPPPDQPQMNGSSPAENGQPINPYLPMQTQTPVLPEMQIHTEAQTQLQAQVPVSHAYSAYHPSYAAVESPPA